MVSVRADIPKNQIAILSTESDEIHAIHAKHNGDNKTSVRNPKPGIPNYVNQQNNFHNDNNVVQHNKKDSTKSRFTCLFRIAACTDPDVFLNGTFS